MPIVSAPAEIFPEGCLLGLGIKETQPDQRHCGIIYRPDENGPRFLHLAFHFDLRDEALNGTYWWAASGLDADNQFVLAALAMVIASGRPNIPYGFDSEGVVFDRKTGELSDVFPGRGLTCATFVLAVFHTYGFEPLELRSWVARPEDEEWQTVILDYMEQHGASQEHMDAIRTNEPNKRYRPEEVVAATAQESVDWSIAYADARALADQVLAEMSV